jgi:calcineurin-like phosphoesterase family protein
VWLQRTCGPAGEIPKVPEGVRIYAVGDVHGRADLLHEKLCCVDADLAAYPHCKPLLVFLGDYIDRGPDSRTVLDLLIGRARSHAIVCLKGNHESYFRAFLQDPDVLIAWRRCGGLETLRSYGLTPSFNPDRDERVQLSRELDTALPPSHRRFLGNLASYFECGDFLFVHAGVRPGVPLAHQRDEDLLWIREDFLLCQEGFSKIVVHGHTPVRAPDVRPNRINIDTGAYVTGRLTCFIIEAGGYFDL